MATKLSLTVLILLSGCNYFESAVDVIAGEECSQNPVATCGDGYICVKGACQPKCETDAECFSGWCREVEDPKNESVCYSE